MTNAIKTANLSAENTFTDSLKVANKSGLKINNFSISGTFVGTLTLQRQFTNETDWYDVDNFTAPYEGTFNEPEKGTKYRLGFKTDDYTSGTANVRVSY